MLWCNPHRRKRSGRLDKYGREVMKLNRPDHVKLEQRAATTRKQGHLPESPGVILQC